MSSAEGNRFAEVMGEFGNEVKELGPLGKGKGEGIDQNELKSKLAEMTKLVPYIKLVKNEKLASRLVNPEEYDKLFTKDEIDKLFSEVISYYIDPEKVPGLHDLREEMSGGGDYQRQEPGPRD